MSEEEQKYMIPRYLDEPLRLILWTWDEWLVFLVPLVLFFWLFNQLLLGLFLGLSAFFGLKKLKGSPHHPRSRELEPEL
jgi:type IV conjugative transfer system protein TraL